MVLKTYMLDAQGCEDLKRQVVTRSEIVSGVAALGGIYISGAGFSLPIAVGVGVILLLSLGIGISRGVKRQREAWLSYELSLNEQSIVRNQSHVPEISIARADVTEIVEERNGTIVVRT